MKQNDDYYFDKAHKINYYHSSNCVTMAHDADVSSFFPYEIENGYL